MTSYKEYLAEGFRDVAQSEEAKLDIAIATGVVFAILTVVAIISALATTFWPIVIAVGFLVGLALVVGAAFFGFTVVDWFLNVRKSKAVARSDRTYR